MAEQDGSPPAGDEARREGEGDDPAPPEDSAESRAAGDAADEQLRGEAAPDERDPAAEEALEEFAAAAPAPASGGAPAPGAEAKPQPGPAAGTASAKEAEAPPGDRPPPPPEGAKKSPYDHVLRIRGEVDTTTSIGLFLGGIVAFLALWFLVTAGGPDPRRLTATVGDDGRIQIPAGDDLEDDTPFRIEGYFQLSPQGELADNEFRQIEEAGARILVFAHGPPVDSEILRVETADGGEVLAFGDPPGAAGEDAEGEGADDAERPRVEDSGRVVVPEGFPAGRVGVEGWVNATYPGAEDFKVILEGEGAPYLQLSASQAGKELDVSYDVGTEPIVSAFILPKPGDVLGALLDLCFGESYRIDCPNPECPSADGPVYLSSGDGAALRDYRERPDEVGEPQVECPRCGTVLDGAIPIAEHAHDFRAGVVSSLGRTTIGFLIALAICFPLGVLAGAFPPIRRFVSPIEIAGGYTPPVVLIPLATAFAGVLTSQGVDASPAMDSARIGYLVVLTSFWLYPMILGEIESVDEVFVNTAYTCGANRWQVIRHVLIPVSMGAIWGHMRVTYAIGWALIILGEAFVGAKIAAAHETGMGLFLVLMQRRHFMGKYFAAVLAIIAVGLVINYLFRVVGRRLFPYQEAA